MRLTDFRWDVFQFYPRTDAFGAGLCAETEGFHRSLAEKRAASDAPHYCYREAGKLPHYAGELYTYRCWVPASEAFAIIDRANAKAAYRERRPFDPDDIPEDYSTQPYDWLGY